MVLETALLVGAIGLYLRSRLEDQHDVLEHRLRRPFAGVIPKGSSGNNNNSVKEEVVEI